MEEMEKVTEEILSLIRETKSNEELKEKLEHYHDSDIASVFAYLTKEERLRLYNVLGDQSISDIFTYLDNVEDYIAELENDKAADIIELMDADDAVDVLDTLEEEDKKDIVEQMDQEARYDVQMISSYDEDEVGSKMTTNFIQIPKTFTIKEAMREIVKEAPENDNIGTIYLHNEDETYFGQIDLKDLIIARSMDSLIDIAKVNYPTLHDTDKVSDCINDLKEYALDMIPVLDKDNHLIGVITSSDIVEVVDDEMSEDYAKLAGLTNDEDLNEPLRKSLKKRLPWLGLLLILGLCVSMIISQFEAVIAVIPMVVFFQSIILDMAGNVGTQSLAVTIRGLVDEDVDKKHLWKMVFKEVRVGFCNGLIVGATSSLMVFLFLLIQHRPITGETFLMHDAMYLALCVFCALVLALTLASFVGTTIPIFFKKIKVDPAVASGPLITTLNDIVAVVTYYGLCMLFFSAIL